MSSTPTEEVPAKMSSPTAEETTPALIENAMSAIDYLKGDMSEEERERVVETLSELLIAIAQRPLEGEALDDKFFETLRQTVLAKKKQNPFPLPIIGRGWQVLQKAGKAPPRRGKKSNRAARKEMSKESIVDSEVEDESVDGQDDGDDAEAAQDEENQATAADEVMPPDDNELYGVGRIMYGLKLRRTVKDNTALTLREDVPPRRADVPGHNGIALGQWWPYQMNVRHSGAHHDQQKAINGKAGVGTYSIVVTGKHHDEDPDSGDTLMYGDHRPKTKDDCLHMAYISEPKQAVRVIRSAGNQGHRFHGPAVGFRYDGLYDVVGEEHKTDSAGNGYLQYKLKRKDGQGKTLRECKERPTEEEKELMKRIEKHKKDFGGTY